MYDRVFMRCSHGFTRCRARLWWLSVPLTVMAAAPGTTHAEGRAEQVTPLTRHQGDNAPQVVLETMVKRGRTYVAEVVGGGVAELTIDPGVQEGIEEVLTTYRVPFGAAVAISIPDGRVLALAGRSTVDSSLGPEELALRPWAPAASVFKVV